MYFTEFVYYLELSEYKSFTISTYNGHQNIVEFSRHHRFVMFTKMQNKNIEKKKLRMNFYQN